MVALNDKITTVLIKMVFKYETFNHDFSLKLLSIEYLQSNLQHYSKQHYLSISQKQNRSEHVPKCRHYICPPETQTSNLLDNSCNLKFVQLPRSAKELESCLEFHILVSHCDKEHDFQRPKNMKDNYSTGTSVSDIEKVANISLKEVSESTHLLLMHHHNSSLFYNLYCSIKFNIIQ